MFSDLPQFHSHSVPIPSKLSNYLIIKGFPSGPSGKESACQCRKCKRLGFDPWVGKIPLEATHSSILAWKIQWTE